MNNENIKLVAERLFFVEKKTIREISNELNVSTKTISKYLKVNINYLVEKAERKKVNMIKQNERKKLWDRKNRNSSKCNEYDKAVLKNQHVRDVGILTFEKF